jgi:hypothetical protein
MIVQRTIAQVTTRKMSEESVEASSGEEKIPLDSATPDMRNPISPRAHIASARISGGWRENGFGGFSELRVWRLDVLEDGISVELSGLVWGAFGALPFGLEKWGTDGSFKFVNKWLIFSLPGITVNLTSQSPQTIFANAIRIV